MEDRLPMSWPATYSEDYRHFDALIWQIPSWSTAVFAAVLSALAIINSNDAHSLIALFRIKPADFSKMLLLGSLLFFAAMYYTLYRWRVHQRYTKRENVPRPLFEWIGAQLFLQFVTGTQVIAILGLLAVTYGIYRSFCLCVFLLFLMTVFVEISLSKHKQKAKKLREQMNGGAREIV